MHFSRGTDRPAVLYQFLEGSFIPWEAGIQQLSLNFDLLSWAGESSKILERTEKTHKKQEKRVTSNEQNPGWEGLTELITTENLLGNFQREKNPFSVQSLSAASASRAVPPGSPGAVQGGNCWNSSTCSSRRENTSLPADPSCSPPPNTFYSQGIITRRGRLAPCPPSRAALGAQGLRRRRFKENFGCVSVLSEWFGCSKLQQPLPPQWKAQNEWNRLCPWSMAGCQSWVSQRFFWALW